ncbi:hypothetical protein [Luteimonas sp. TWI1437]|uniref:DUF6988 family protein n=1 Tax=unclassified Luteimonas TaxID=2629088 RepID=UPI00320818D2
MLNDLAASSAEPALPKSLLALKEKAWNALNSYTHGGLRLIIRSLEGFEEELLAWMLRTTNSLSYIAAQLIAHVANDPARSINFLDVCQALPNCMHPREVDIQTRTA